MRLTVAESDFLIAWAFWLLLAGVVTLIWWLL